MTCCVPTFPVTTGLVLCGTLVTVQIENANARIFSMGEGPISCMKRQHHKLYVCCGEEVLEVYIADFTIQHRWNAAHPRCVVAEYV